MADKFYSAGANAQLPKDVAIGDATASTKVELRVDTTVKKHEVLEALEAIKNSVVKNYKAGA